MIESEFFSVVNRAPIGKISKGAPRIICIVIAAFVTVFFIVATLKEASTRQVMPILIDESPDAVVKNIFFESVRPIKNMPEEVYLNPFKDQPLWITWTNTCVPERVEIIGIGMGDGRNITNPQTITQIKPYEIDWTEVQVAGKLSGNTSLPDIVTITGDLMPSIYLTRPIFVDDTGYSFVTTVTPTFQIEAHMSDEMRTARGLIVYSNRKIANERWTSIGFITNTFFLGNVFEDDVLSTIITFPDLEASTDITLTSIVIDNNNDDRSMTISISSLGLDETVLSSSQVITNSTHGDLLNLSTLLLRNVPTGTNQVTVTLRSPKRPNGDSLIFSGVNISYPCLPQETDLEISKTAVITQAIVGKPLTYTIKTVNTGPGLATDVVVKDMLPENANYVQSWSSQGECNDEMSTGIITCTLGELPIGKFVTTKIVVVPTIAEPIRNVVKVESGTIDPELDSNIALHEMSVVSPTYMMYLPIAYKSLNLTVNKVSEQSIINYGLPLAYTITVANYNTQTVTAVTLTDKLPTGVILDSNVTSDMNQKCSSDSSIINCVFNDLEQDAVAEIMITTIPQVAGFITNVAYASNPVKNIGSNRALEVDWVHRCIIGPNDSRREANGPLLPGLTYCGTLEDSDDFYYIDLTKTSQISVTLVNPIGPEWPAATKLTLYDGEKIISDCLVTYNDGSVEIGDCRCCNSRESTISLKTSDNLTTGRYYIGVWAHSINNRTYMLTVDYDSSFLSNSSMTTSCNSKPICVNASTSQKTALQPIVIWLTILIPAAILRILGNTTNE